MEYGVPSGIVTFWEDFLRDNVTNLVETAGGSAVQDINASSDNGGWWRMQLAGDEGDDLILAGEVVWEVDEGQPLTFETRVKPSTVSAQNIQAGMSDANTESSGVSAVDSDAGTLTATATDGVYFLADESTGGTLDTVWSGVGISSGNLRTGAGTTATQTNAALNGSPAMVAGTTQVLRMILTAANSGSVRFHVGTANEMGGGTLYPTNSTVRVATDMFRSSVALCPFLGAEDRGVDTDIDFDYIFVQAPR